MGYIEFNAMHRSDLVEYLYNLIVVTYLISPASFGFGSNRPYQQLPIR